MNKYLPFFIVILVLLSAISVCAQINLDKKDSITKKGKRRDLFAFPAVTYSPETTLAFGGAGNYYFKLGHERDSTIARTSYIQALGLYTLRKQAVFGFESVIFFRDENYILKTKGSASYFPDRFWGLGNSSADAYEKYTIGQYYFFPQLLRKVYKNIFVGVAYELQNVFSFEYGQGLPANSSLFDKQNVAGRKGSFVSGFGLVTSWDGRDNAFSPSKGFYFSYYVNDFSSVFGSKYDFVSHTIDLRKYLSITKKQVLAFQVMAFLNNGNVPLRSMANIGSNTIMRGYYEGRYTDNNLLAAQVEHRFPVYNRFGMVLFAAAGKVGNSTKEVFTINQLKPAYGTGLRYSIDKKEKLNLRFDVAFGRHSNGLYFYITEAF